MRVHHLDCGTMHPPGGRLVDGRPGLFRRAELVCHCLLVETDSELVLVETGLGLRAATHPEEWLGRNFVKLFHPVLDPEISAVRQIERLGYSPSDVRHVVLTHLDRDHAGGLADFPHATVHVHEAELRALRAQTDGREQPRYWAKHFAHGPRFESYSADGESWFGFEAVRELKGLPPEILLVPLAGHTRGHTGVAIDTGTRWLFHAGDAYYHPNALDPAGPKVPWGLGLFERRMETIAGSRLRNRRRLAELIRTPGATVSVFNAHDATDFARMAGSHKG
jgi:glyoxylase-like metal-dependent hydrolase (beta-lactamase superfamily II)